MSGVWGEYLKLSIFGESHGQGIGIVLNGLPAGLRLDMEYIGREMARRAPGRDPFTTSRREKDELEILSGFFNGMTTGSPLCCLIRNQDRRSSDYEVIKDIMRPSHADYTARQKYSGCNDYRGGGHFSGRVTAPLVFAGAVAKQVLGKKEIFIGSHILSIADIREEAFDPVKVDQGLLQELAKRDYPVLDQAKAFQMKQLILKTGKEDDSLGGIVETAAVNLPAGLGAPFFDSAESKICHLIFAVPAVKGIEFGAGFPIAEMRGSKANDSFILKEGRVLTATNNSGGIQGGITNGMPLIFRTAIKPTPSIGLAQKTVDMKKMEETEIRTEGRHDTCIVPRAVPVIEAAAALALLDLMIEKDGTGWMI